jgi:outer membrane protein TolC
LFASNLKAQTNYLTYERFLKNVLNNNPVATQSQNLIELSNYQYKAAKGNYDPVISSSFNNKFFNSKDYFTLFQSEIKQPIFTSQYLKMGYEYASGNFLNPNQITSSLGLPYAGVEVGLLQGLMFDKRRAEVLKSTHYLDYYRAEKNDLINNLLFQSSQTYFEYLYIEKLLKLNDFFLKLAEQRLNGIKELATSGEKPAIDTVEANILLQSRQLEMQSSTVDKSKKLAELNSFNRFGEYAIYDKSVSDYLVTDSLEMYFESTKQQLLKMLKNDTINNPVLTLYKSKQQILEVEQRLKKEMIKPKLDVNYNFLSNQYNSQYLVFNSANYKWGANLTLPLFLRTARNEYKMAQITSQNNSLMLVNKINELQYKQQAIKQSLVILFNQVNNSEKSVKYSKLLLEAEVLKFENGESSLFMINTRENKWLESELKLAEYKLKFIKTALHLIHINGNLDYFF